MIGTADILKIIRITSTSPAIRRGASLVAQPSTRWKWLGTSSFLAHPVLSNVFVEVKQSVRSNKRVRAALSLFQQHVSNGDRRRRVTISHWYRDLCQYLTASVGQML